MIKVEKKNIQKASQVFRAAGLAAAMLCSHSAPAVEIQSANFADRLVQPNEELRIKLSSLIDPAGGRLAFVDGATDLTPFFRQTGLGEFVYSGKELLLAPGQRQFKVFLVKDGQWRELRSFELKVATEGGFETFALKPRLDVTMKGQLDQGRSGSAPQFARTNYQDGTLQGGLGIEAAQGNFRLSSNVNIVGSTVRSEAIQFSTRGEAAPKADISDYLVNTQYGQSQLSLGHISYGNNPLLMMNYGSRGITFKHQIIDRVDFSFNAMNGTSIVGADNLLGLNESQHQVHGGTLGVELLERKGGLRVEMQMLDASLQSQGSFNAGSIPDAEKIRGLALRLLGTDASGRLRADLVLARAKHTTVSDPILAQGQTLTAIAPVTSNARAFDLAYDLVKPDPGVQTPYPFGLTATLHHDRIDSLYKSVGIGFPSDQLLNRVGLAAQLGPLSGALTISRREDNLEDIPSLLKTRTDIEGVTFNLPLAQVWPGEAGVPQWWLPSLGYRHENNHQRAINVPVAALSSFTGSLPDQVTKVDSLSANWQDQQWQFAYGFNLSTVDNRQIGREAADFRNTGHTLQGGYRFAPTFGVTAGFGRTANRSDERSLTTYTYNYAGGFDWQFLENWNLNGNYTLTKGQDSQNLTDSRGWSTQTQVSRRFLLDSFNDDRKLPGQVFLRHILNDNFNRDNTFGLLNEGRFWMIQSGVTVSFF